MGLYYFAYTFCFVFGLPCGGNLLGIFSVIYPGSFIDHKMFRGFMRKKAA